MAAVQTSRKQSLLLRLIWHRIVSLLTLDTCFISMQAHGISEHVGWPDVSSFWLMH